MRPSHTYDETLIPLEGGWTQIDRMRRGKPIVVHGDGTSLWTLTHTATSPSRSSGCSATRRAIGDTFQITSDEAMPWDAIARMLGRRRRRRADDRARRLGDASRATIPEWGPGLLGDKAHSVSSTTPR